MEIAVVNVRPDCEANNVLSELHLQHGTHIHSHSYNRVQPSLALAYQLWLLTVTATTANA